MATELNDGVETGIAMYERHSADPSAMTFDDR
jgi:hypothetical protein